MYVLVHVHGITAQMDETYYMGIFRPTNLNIRITQHYQNKTNKKMLLFLFKYFKTNFVIVTLQEPKQHYSKYTEVKLVESSFNQINENSLLFTRKHFIFYWEDHFQTKKGSVYVSTDNDDLAIEMSSP